ncbi:MAG: vWA domain-containing protein, partial [Pseudomonadota bacterium]
MADKKLSAACACVLPSTRSFAFLVTLSFVFVNLPPAQAQEEQVKPYVMLLFDTSGSMIWNICDDDYSCINGDNSIECPGNQISCGDAGCLCTTFGCGNGIADDARLYKVKKGAYSVVSAFGEVTFGLSRFEQNPASFTCSGTSGRVGGWVSAGCSSGTPLLNPGNRADVLVEFADGNQNEMLLWMNNCDDWPNAGACPQDNAPTTGCSLCSECGTGCDMELRASGNTPIAGSLKDLRVNFFPTVIANDLKKECRPYRVILLTDGQNNCGGVPKDEAQALFELPDKSIPVHVIGFGRSALKTLLDAIADGGGTGEAIIVEDEISLALAMASIISESILIEKCNNADEDCDDLCDETWPEVGVTNTDCTNQRAAQTCTVGRGECRRTGTYVCKADESGSECSVTAGTPVTEICWNGLDDDCDGQVDEDCQICSPQPEICDGKDNDCDGKIDTADPNMVPLPASCGPIKIGECKPGTPACTNGQVVCNGFVGPTPEICDNKDNNCDGIIDNFREPCFPFASGCDVVARTCQGVCTLGSKLCTAGTWGACQGALGPTIEVCNGLDDNCDGTVDEGVASICRDYKTCNTYPSCTSCPSPPKEVCNGKDDDCNNAIDDNPIDAGKSCVPPPGTQFCGKGTLVCENGVLVCKGTPGDTEICNGIDDDCNNKIDDNIDGEGDECYPAGEPGCEKDN